jgi:GT2 family glycosyltransferase
LNRQCLDLEILILSFNKSEYTLQLLQSISNFEPTAPLRISVLDQGSSPGELQNLERGIKDRRVHLIKGDRNLGVAGGRQKLLTLTAREWVLFLDNDLTFNSDFLESCSKITDISNFACLPFIEESQGNLSDVVIPKLYSTPLVGRKYSQEFGLGTESKNYDQISYPYKISAVAGGVLLAKTETLRNLGGFRGPGKAGYEDLDLTLRLKQKNGEVFLIPLALPMRHNKQIDGNAIAKRTELVRLDPFQLRANARFVEYKFQSHIWSIGQYNWLASRAITAKSEVEMLKLLVPNLETPPLHIKRKKVLLVCDSPGWAFERIAMKQKVFLSDSYDFTVTFSNQWEVFKTQLLYTDWDAVIFLWRIPLFQLVREGVIPAELMKKIGYCIYDHQGALGYSAEILALENLDVPVGVVNETLFESLKNSVKNLFLIPDGVDTGLFKPFKSLGENNQRILVGWSGNTKWGGVDDVKGFSRVIQPCIEKIKEKNLPIDFDIIDSSNGRIPQNFVANTMKNWDVVICASRHEGTPNPILEGLASGLAIVSTSVGMTPELIREGAEIVLIPEDVNYLLENLKILSALKINKGLSEVKVKNRKVAQKYDWRETLTNHKIFIENVLRRKV